jgi:hypothetical protein
LSEALILNLDIERGAIGNLSKIYSSIAGCGERRKGGFEGGRLKNEE